MHVLRAFAVLFCLLLWGTTWAETRSPAGKIDLIGGDVRLLQSGKPIRPALMGEAVYEGDTLITGKDSEAHVTMSDSGFLALRPNTTLQIVSYTADGGDDDKGVFQLVAGGLRSITGWIGKFNRKSYTLRTPTATIGIRGTDHETHYIPPGSTEGEPGTYDKVFAGETSIETEAGQAAVVPDHAGYVSDTARQPRVLPGIPGFFRPGPHEDIINRKHAEIQQMIIERRNERRKIVAEKLAELKAARQAMLTLAEQNKAAAEERKEADEEQRKRTEVQTAAIRDKDEQLQQKQKAVVELRKAIFENISGVLARNIVLREQMKSVRERWQAIAATNKEIAQARKALSDKNAQAGEARKAAVEEQRKQTEAQLGTLSDTGRALQEKQKQQQEAAQTLEEKIAASNASDRADIAVRRQALRDAGDALARERHAYQDALNAVYEENVTANETRMQAAAEQRRQMEIALAAIHEKEQAVQRKLMANEDDLEAIQARAAALVGKDDGLAALIKSEHEAVAAQRALRKDIQAARRALHDSNIAAIDARQQAALDQLNAMHARHREVREKGIDLMNERESMQQEIRSLFEQEQKRYRDELNADRQLVATYNLQSDAQ
ncbi:MAG TPA: FecR domain-containing protein [Burkholderiaceae bacterium]|jgi:hypothetical protein